MRTSCALRTANRTVPIGELSKCLYGRRDSLIRPGEDKGTKQSRDARWRHAERGKSGFWVRRGGGAAGYWAWDLPWEEGYMRGKESDSRHGNGIINL